MAKKLSPADYVIAQFGGVTATAKALGLNKSSVCLWRTRSKGQIPATSWTKLLRAARALGKNVQPSHLYSIEQPQRRKAAGK